MARDYTTTGLLKTIKNRAMIPTSQLTLQDTDILDLATEELWLGVLPFMMKQRSEYFVVEAPDAPIVTGQAAYPIPTRAVGQKVANVMTVDPSGNLFSIPQIEKDDRVYYTQSAAVNNGFVFYFENNNIILVPTPTTSTGISLRLTYYIRPGELVPIDSAGQITDIDTNTNTLTISGTSLPSTFVVGAAVDFINGRPGFEHKATDQVISGSSGLAISFAALPANLAVGDWVAVASESPLPQVPPELHPMLAQRTAIKVCEALGDAQAVQTAETKLKQMEEAASHLISPRADQNPKKLINRNSTLRSIKGGSYIRY